ncbi:MAG TPA: type II toxin-antitoxin system VapC family toxin [Candidatus Cybelea sp.]|nr:type II toxin-antitoxin system VapC family toxin [Candidatus Cybelea sp.]
MMRVLLDTHALVWWLEAKGSLSRKAKETIEESETVVFVSAASGWELAIKTQIGKFKSAQLVTGLEKEIEKEGFIELPVSMKHALLAGSLDSTHKDPFDRLLIAQAQVERVPIVSNDKVFDGFSVHRLW